MREEVTYVCPVNPKHKQTVYVTVKQVNCGKCKGNPLMRPKGA